MNYYHNSGKLSRRKLLRIGGKDDFRGENFSGLLACAVPRTPHPQILWRKLLLIATKLRNLRKFSPSKVSRYTVITPLNAKFLSLQTSFSLHMLLTHLYLHFCPSSDSKTEPITTSSLNKQTRYFDLPTH